MVNSDFDLARLRVDLADPRFRRVGKPKKWRREYVQFPWTWIEGLQAAKRVSTYRLALLLVYEHSLVKHNDLSRVNAAFFTMNGFISIGFLLFVAADVMLMR